jgi:phosphopantothenoylcysteine decarboxylase/phosphopantothenate--cysteine ligase
VILLSIGPGPGALRAPEISHELAEAGHRVEVVLETGTPGFVGPAAFGDSCRIVEEPSERPRAVLLAPATAAALARLARGMSGSPALDLWLGGVRPVIAALEADGATASHPAVLDNVRVAIESGCRVLATGEGVMAPSGRIVAESMRAMGGDLSGLRMLVTAGGTREPIDSVRFIGNRSSGKMGAAIAREAVRRGAEVCVVAANVEREEPGVDWVPVETFGELRDAVMERAGGMDALIMAAAVSDFTPASPSKAKIRRGERLTVELTATEDILKAVSEGFPELFVVGFAATHGDPVADAREKLRSKGVDLVVGNDISRTGIGFGADENEVHIVGKRGERFVPRASKAEVARAILDALAERTGEVRKE